MMSFFSRLSLGTYLLNVLWASKQVKGCPLKVSILPRCDASRVLCSGDGLRGGAVGKDIKAFIDTKRAGPGNQLTLLCHHKYLSLFLLVR